MLWMDRYDYYEGTDFYDLAKAYSDDGYALFDIGKTYEVWGGCFFKEGFLACTSAFTIAVVRTDVDTMNAFLKGDYNGMVQLESYENELTDNGDGTSTLSADMTLIQAYAEGEPVYVTNHADAVMYDQTSIAVVQMLWPWA